MSTIDPGPVGGGSGRDPHRLLRPDDAAAVLSVRTSWIYEAVRTRRLPCVRVGRHIRFTQAMLDEWVANHTDG